MEVCVATLNDSQFLWKPYVSGFVVYFSNVIHVGFSNLATTVCPVKTLAVTRCQVHCRPWDHSN